LQRSPKPPIAGLRGTEGRGRAKREGRGGKEGKVMRKGEERTISPFFQIFW